MICSFLRFVCRFFKYFAKKRIDLQNVSDIPLCIYISLVNMFLRIFLEIDQLISSPALFEDIHFVKKDFVDIKGPQNKYFH